MAEVQKRLGEILIEKGLITPEELARALEEQKRTKEFLGVILLRRTRIKERDLLAALSKQFDIPLASIKEKYIDWGLVKQFSSSLILDHKCFPIERSEWAVTFAITNPLDVWVMQKVQEEAMGLRVKLVLVASDDMKSAIERYREYMKGNISKLFE